MSNKASKIASDAFLPVPEGTRIRYQHYYIRKVLGEIILGKRTHEGQKETEPKISPPILVGTVAWLVTEAGEEIPNTHAASMVHPNDTAVKKLGRLKAHNRCIKAYLKDHP